MIQMPWWRQVKRRMGVGLVERSIPKSSTLPKGASDPACGVCAVGDIRRETARRPTEPRHLCYQVVSVLKAAIKTHSRTVSPRSQNDRLIRHHTYRPDRTEKTRGSRVASGVSQAAVEHGTPDRLFPAGPSPIVAPLADPGHHQATT